MTKIAREFRPTHLVHIGNGEPFEVMYDQQDEGGPAYTRNEWDFGTLADIEVDGDGKWFVCGKPLSSLSGGWEVIFPEPPVDPTMAEVRCRAERLRFDLLNALPNDDRGSEGTQHALIAYSLLQQAYYHLELASMKGVR